MFARHGVRVSARRSRSCCTSTATACKRRTRPWRAAQHPDRNAQFEHINAKAEDCIKRGEPVISVDTKKKELVGNFKNGGTRVAAGGRARAGARPRLPRRAIGKAIPYGVYDSAPTRAGSASASTTTRPSSRSRRSGVVAADGPKRYPNARESSSPPTRAAATATSHVWKYELQRFADKLGSRSTSATSRRAPASGTRSSTGCSPYHENWRGRPLRVYETSST